ncbi:MAG: FmdB family zinc ribbon protein [Candidatus Caldatribacteriaceae bacterium]
MPTYEYRCQSCGNIMEVKASLQEKERGIDLTCPQCGSKDFTQILGNFILGCSPKSDTTSNYGGSCYGGGCSCCS